MSGLVHKYRSWMKQHLNYYGTETRELIRLILYTILNYLLADLFVKLILKLLSTYIYYYILIKTKRTEIEEYFEVFENENSANNLFINGYFNGMVKPILKAF